MTGPALVRVEGAGLGAACAGHVMRQAGLRTDWRQGLPRPEAPALLLSDAALALIADVFGPDERLARLPRITRRVVLWGGDEARAVPHDAVVAMPGDLPAPVRGEHQQEQPAFTLHAGQAPKAAGPLMQFGHRPASACRATLNAGANRAAASIEAVAQGWLFLIPAGDDSGWLLGVGGPIDDLLGQSRLIAPQLVAAGAAAGQFETAPRMLPRLADAGWLALGSGALAFDPICGDGSAQSLRSAILASAVIGAALNGLADEPSLLAHYQAMLIAAMRRHLQISANFYASGGNGPWWREQLAATARGYDWCTSQLALCPQPRFTLRGFALHARELAA